jgi:hypothetical protein
MAWEANSGPGTAGSVGYIIHARLTYDCRHAAAAMLPEEGVSRKEVREMLGIASMTLTAGLYSHVTPVEAETGGCADDALGGHADKARIQFRKLLRALSSGG